MNIAVDLGDGIQIGCRAVITVPETALADATYIHCFSIDSQVRSKHEFHTLAQIALMMFADEEIKPQRIKGVISLEAGEDALKLESGMIICRLESNDIAIYVNSDHSPRKYLEVAHRYCTRWVRLDI